MMRGFQAMERNLEAPMASTAIVLHLSHSMDMIEFRVLLVHFVSCMKKMDELSYLILFFIIRCFEVLLSPRMFQDMSFIIEKYKG